MTKLIATRLAGITLAVAVNCYALAAECTPQRDPWLSLAIAMQKDQIESLDCLISSAMLNGSDPSDIKEQTPLHMAANFNRPRVVYYLLQRGAFVDNKNFLDKTPLVQAIESGSDDAAAVLILNGATLEQTDAQGRTALFWSVIHKNVAVTNLLLLRGANPDQQVSIYSPRGDRHTTIRALGKKSKNSAIRSLFNK